MQLGFLQLQEECGTRMGQSSLVLRLLSTTVATGTQCQDVCGTIKSHPRRILPHSHATLNAFDPFHLPVAHLCGAPASCCSSMKQLINRGCSSFGFAPPILIPTVQVCDWRPIPLRCGEVHGAQKGFVEHLNAELGRVCGHYSVFFDTDAIQHGEQINTAILEYAKTCKLAVAVLSEEYFTRSRSPMMELVASYTAAKDGNGVPCLLPVFLALRPEDAKDHNMESEWWKTWQKWELNEKMSERRKSRPSRVQPIVWKEAVDRLLDTRGPIYKPHENEYSPEILLKKVAQVIALKLDVLNRSLQQVKVKDQHMQQNKEELWNGLWNDRSCASAAMAGAAAARWTVIWLHGLGDSGPANESLASFFTAPELKNFKWRFPSAPYQRVSCNGGAMMPSWFDLLEIPIVAESPNVDADILKAVESVHEMIDKEVAAGVSANNIFLCGFSQGGALTLASSMLYPKTLAGAAVFSGWVPLDKAAFAAKITPAAKQTPVMWLHGLDDQVVKFSAGQAGPPFLARADVKCDFHAIPGLGHGIDAQELSALQRWMKERLQ